MRLFKSTVLQEYGLGCDCCVVTLRVKIDVFAQDETASKEILRAWAGVTSIHLENMEDLGEISKVMTPGVKIGTSIKLFEGVYYDSPFPRQPVSLL